MQHIPNPSIKSPPSTAAPIITVTKRTKSLFLRAIDLINFFFLFLNEILAE